MENKIFAERLLAVPPKDVTLPEEIFANSYKILKFVKVFSFKEVFHYMVVYREWVIQLQPKHFTKTDSQLYQ